MIGKPGPFRIIRSDDSGNVEAPLPPPRRRFYCNNYQKCLDLAAALNWDNFTCRGCSGAIDQNLLWRAYAATKRDGVAGALCDIPEVDVHTNGQVPSLKIVKAG